jgi:hypothetical protein
MASGEYFANATYLGIWLPPLFPGSERNTKNRIQEEICIRKYSELLISMSTTRRLLARLGGARWLTATTSVLWVPLKIPGDDRTMPDCCGTA